MKESGLNDTSRINWLEENDGVGLISDDAGRWAVSTAGMQNMPNPDEPIDIMTSFFVEAKEWKLTIREAIDYAIKQEMLE